MDLNLLPRESFDFPCNLEIKIICRKKASCRALLVRKYGEERYNEIIRNPDSMVLTNIARSIIIVLILYN